MTGNLYHHIHNLALLAVPFAKRPNLVRWDNLCLLSKINKQRIVAELQHVLYCSTQLCYLVCATLKFDFK